MPGRAERTGTARVAPARRRDPRPLPLGVPLLGILLAVLFADRTLGLTSLLVSPLDGFADGLLPGGPEALLADVVAVLVVLAVLLVVELSGRPRTRRGLLVALVIAALVGLQLGASAVSAATGMTVATDLYLARALLLAVTTLAALLVLAALAEHRQVTQELRRATSEAESLAASGRAALSELRESVAGRVREVLRDALAVLDAGGPAGSGARLRSLADEVLRPLSHRLAGMPTPSPAPRAVAAAPRWRDTFETLLRTPVIEPQALALLAAGLAFLRSLVTDQDRVRDLSPAIPPDAEGVGVALTVDVVPLLIVFAELAVVFVITRWAAVRLARLLGERDVALRPVRAWTLVSAGLAGVAVLTTLAAALVDLVAGLGADLADVRGAFVAALLPLVVVTFGASLVAAVAEGQGTLEAGLARQRAETARTAARVQAVLGHEQRRLARSLHADVQAAVNAAGLMLDRADRDGAVSAVLVDDAAERIAAAVERFLSGGISRRTLAERLEEVRALWAGVCTVVLELAEESAARIDADPVARELVVDLVTEACANAAVHGGAGEVRVRIGLVGEEVSLDVTDDGTPATRVRGPEGGPAESPAGGLGTAILRASCTRFGLELGERGGHLHARVPLG